MRPPSTPHDRLLQGLRAGTLSEVRAALEAGVDPNAKVYPSFSFLEVAAAEGSVEAVRLLLDAGALFTDQWKVALSRDHGEVFRLMLAHDPGLADLSRAPLPSETGKFDAACAPLVYAIAHSRTKQARLMLETCPGSQVHPDAVLPLARAAAGRVNTGWLDALAARCPSLTGFAEGIAYAAAMYGSVSRRAHRVYGPALRWALTHGATALLPLNAAAPDETAFHHLATWDDDVLLSLWGRHHRSAVSPVQLDDAVRRSVAALSYRSFRCLWSWRDRAAEQALADAHGLPLLSQAIAAIQKHHHQYIQATPPLSVIHDSWAFLRSVFNTQAGRGCDSRGRTPLHVALDAFAAERPSHLSAAVDPDFLRQMVRLLLRAGFRWSDRDHDGRSARDCVRTPGFLARAPQYAAQLEAQWLSEELEAASPPAVRASVRRL